MTVSRRGFFGATLAGLGAVLLPGKAVVDPMVAFLKPTNKNEYLFIRESEAEFVREATYMANRTALEFDAVWIGRDSDGVPYIREAEHGQEDK